MIKKISSLFLLALIVSCNTSLSIAEMPNYFSNKKKIDVSFFAERIQNIDSYISYIDYNSNDTSNFSADNLKSEGKKRVISGNESSKKVILKNKEIVKVRYFEYLKNNLINSKEFYYNNNSLVCIKLNDITLNNSNQSVLNQRIIYVEDEKSISDSGEFNAKLSSRDLVHLGVDSFKKEYNILY